MPNTTVQKIDTQKLAFSDYQNIKAIFEQLQNNSLTENYELEYTPASLSIRHKNDLRPLTIYETNSFKMQELQSSLLIENDTIQIVLYDNGLQITLL
ncbi:MAG: hypothetical protein ACPG45_10750 [Flavobacteriaceae bacterium]